MDNWLDYFLSLDSNYLPMWAKVWAFQGMLGIGNLNKEKNGYLRRSKTTIYPFVSFDSEVLGKSVELLKQVFSKKELDDKELEKLIKTQSFAKIYGKLLAGKKSIKIISNEGVWIKYNRELESESKRKELAGMIPEYLKLYNSLQGYNTGWCTAGSRETTKEQMRDGDFYVYYSKDDMGEYKIPRLAIKMNGNKIGEIRGIAEKQNVEPDMKNILKEKLVEFPNVSKYYKMVKDMERISDIYSKYKVSELSVDDLKFLYEIDEEIIGFGYRIDPRVGEIIKDRDIKGDLAKIFNCSVEEIGISPEELKINCRYKYYYKNLHLSYLEKIDNLLLPERIGGSMFLNDLTSIEKIVFPKQVDGSLYMRDLVSAKEVVFPKTLNGSMFLENLRYGEELIFPEVVSEDLELGSLISIDNLILPREIGGNLVLNPLLRVNNCVLPEKMGEDSIVPFELRKFGSKR